METGIEDQDLDAATEYLKLETDDKEYQAMEQEFIKNMQEIQQAK